MGSDSNFSLQSSNNCSIIEKTPSFQIEKSNDRISSSNFAQENYYVDQRKNKFPESVNDEYFDDIDLLRVTTRRNKDLDISNVVTNLKSLIFKTKF